MPVKQIEWSEELPPNKECPYNHMIGKTPFGNFTIEWKGWKSDHSYCAHHQTFDYFCSLSSLEDVKAGCQKWFNETVTNCLTDN